jgi:hypothetical protein
VPTFHGSATLEPSGSLDVERLGYLKLGTVSGQGLTGAVGQLLAGLQVQPLNVIAVLGKGRQRRVSHCLYIRTFSLFLSSVLWIRIRADPEKICIKRIRAPPLRFKNEFEIKLVKLL